MTFLNPPGGWNYWWCRADFGPSADIDPGFWKIEGPLSMTTGDHGRFRGPKPATPTSVGGRTLRRVVDSGWLWIWQAGLTSHWICHVFWIWVCLKEFGRCWCKDFQNEQWKTLMLWMQMNLGVNGSQRGIPWDSAGNIHGISFATASQKCHSRFQIFRLRDCKVKAVKKAKKQIGRSRCKAQYFCFASDFSAWKSRLVVQGGNLLGTQRRRVIRGEGTDNIQHNPFFFTISAHQFLHLEHDTVSLLQCFSWVSV